jgi:transcriptional/translational regulatory protein YebC/TACO1
MLKLIDLGVEDVEETEDGIEVYVPPTDLSSVKEKIEEKDYKIISTDLVQKPKTYQKITDEKTAKKILKFLETLEERDDVQKVFANLDIPRKYLNNE